MNQTDWRDEFSRKMCELTGHCVANYNILSDENGWYYYIQAKSLVSNHPLLMNHYRGQLFVVIPFEEYRKLEEGTINPISYIENAYWSIGYYWGGGSMVGGVFWKPLEDTTGIHNKELVNRYLYILACRTHKKSSGYMTPEEQCFKCPVKQCPFSNCPEKMNGASWENEVKEHDYRRDIFAAFAKRAKSELDLELRGLICHSGDTALLIPDSCRKDTCKLYLPVALNNDILYHPGNRNWDEVAASLEIELGVLFDNQKRARITDELPLPAPEFCRDFWKSCGAIGSWYPEEQHEEINAANENQPAEKIGIFKRIVNFFASAIK